MISLFMLPRRGLPIEKAQVQQLPQHAFHRPGSAMLIL